MEFCHFFQPLFAVGGITQFESIVAGTQVGIGGLSPVGRHFYPFVVKSFQAVIIIGECRCIIIQCGKFNIERFVAFV